MTDDPQNPTLPDLVRELAITIREQGLQIGALRHLVIMLLRHTGAGRDQWAAQADLILRLAMQNSDPSLPDILARAETLILAAEQSRG